jgi:hypothetical protein
MTKGVAAGGSVAGAAVAGSLAASVAGGAVGSTAAASGFDTEHAWPWYSYLIVRVEQGRGLEAASWTLDHEQPIMRPEPLEVLSEV